MKHRIFTVLAAISLLLFIALLALWADTGYLLGSMGYRSTRFQIGTGYPTRHYVVGVDSRTLHLGRNYFFGPPGAPRLSQSHLGISYLALLPAFAIMPTWWLLAYRRRRMARLRPGHCPTCDYDLRASKERCPECGTPISPSDLAKESLER